MSSHDTDLFVIGAGSGGVRASRIAATLGARVTVCEDSDLGGTCVNLGCVPKKLMVYASGFSSEFEDAAGFGWSVGERSFDWRPFLQAKNAEILRLNGVYGRLLDGAGVRVLRGRGRIVGPHAVEVDGVTHTAERILIATGGRPFVPPIPGAELGITSDQVFHLPELPRRIVVLGGGYIAVEFAGIFHGLGSEVTQLYRGPLFLRGFDADLREHLAREMRSQGIDLRFDACPERIEQVDGGLRVVLPGGESVEADQVLWATGRVPNVEGLGLAELGVEQRPDGAIVVDDEYRTSVPSIYALGDVTGRVQLTPVALEEGMLLARRFFGGAEGRLSYENIPTCVFSTPNLGTVGLTEEEARRRFERVQIFRSSFRPMKHTLSGREERTLMKLVVDAESDRVVGVHMAGPDAGETIQGFAVALNAGATKAVFDATVGIHPTAAEEFVTMRTPVED